MIRTVKIFPPIGIARLGKSPDGYFIGPERPVPPTVPDGGFRDGAGLIKRQAARFRLFGFDEKGKLMGEVTFDQAAAITWTVRIANTKAAADRFFGRAEPNPGPRNAAIQNRDQLKLAPDAVSVSGKNANFTDLGQSRTAGMAKEFMINQEFLGRVIQLGLGTATTDDQGRLLVLGGHGESKSPTGNPLNAPGSNFANHDGWYDDVSDGVVSATVTLKDGSNPTVTSAWVVVAPPKYAPGIHSIVTLYDTLLQVAVDRNLMPVRLPTRVQAIDRFRHSADPDSRRKYAVGLFGREGPVQSRYVFSSHLQKSPSTCQGCGVFQTFDSLEKLTHFCRRLVPFVALPYLSSVRKSVGPKSRTDIGSTVAYA